MMMCVSSSRSRKLSSIHDLVTAVVHASSGPLKIPVKVGSRFRPIWGLVSGPKSAEIRVLWVDLVPDIPKSAFDGWTLVPNL
jgi:hypothetical protein